MTPEELNGIEAVHSTCCPHCGKSFAIIVNPDGLAACNHNACRVTNPHRFGCGWTGHQRDLVPPTEIRVLLAAVRALDTEVYNLRRKILCAALFQDRGIV